MNTLTLGKNLNIAYIGGGSRGWAWGLMSDLALEKNLSGTVKLYDLNYDAARQNEMIGNRLYDREDVVGKWKYQAVKTMEEALVDADFVIISILPGTFSEMLSDVHEPEKYGIYQSVGDTIGPGGLVRALRTIPIFVEIANQIKEFAPNAWVINYTNPMSLCVRTLYETFPEIKAIGCCHEVFGTQKLLATMVEEMLDIKNVSYKDIKVNVLGINHFTWIDVASYLGIDLFPLYKQFVDKYHETGFEGNEKGHWMNDHFSSAQRVKFDLFKKFGLIAAAGDRHLAEFMPASWYLQSPEKVKEWKFGLTKVQWRIDNKQELLEKGRRLAEGKEEFILHETGEEGIEMIKALLGLGDLVTNVNLPNRGQIEGLPFDAVVETNAIFRNNSIKPICAGKLPTPIENMVSLHIRNQETTLQAALSKDKSLAFQAFVQDPLVQISPDDAKELLDKMLYQTKDYLQGWNIKEEITVE
ncbi:alpha-glucosidase/alpha-galactosidase [Bacillus sp. 7586-K]|uniref:Alpha-galactosidase n=1 Tax=Metabacillus niabensis TaxID=324854 RepID=A0ABT9Z5Y7_9BACI|nr:alpha-glucosidase/alpha-galactosidase [Metabacillus niabensis]MDQ0227389.1 alpha-galactosidase [Metabacillus niabensis]PAD69137.1 alpha-glucosidase/alpha-galactosidase [Bacillus sp. 7586-K]